MTTELIRVELPGDRLYIDECKIQTFTYKDASSISLLYKSKDTNKLFEIIDRRINLNVMDLTLQDFWFILHWQRVNSYSSFPINLPWNCPHCKTKNTDELTGSKLIINDIDPEYEHGLEIDFEGIGPTKVRLKLVKDEIQVKKFMRENKYPLDDIELFEELLTACMLEPNGGDLYGRLQLVRQMDANDQFILKSFETEFDYGVENFAEFTCENCKEVAKVGYSFDLARFFPNLQDKSNVRSRILSRKTSKSTDRLDSESRLHASDLYKGNSYKESEEVTRKTEPTKSSNESQEKIELTPEELQRLINEGVDSAIKDSIQEIESNTSLDDITANR